VSGDILVFWWDARTRAGPSAGGIPWTRLSDPPINDHTPGGLRLRRWLDCRIVDPISGREVAFRTNQFGFRGPIVRPKAPGECRILVLGDSITLSSYTAEAESYPAQLERILSGEGRLVTVINAGMRGASLREELLILTESGLFTQPDVVVVGLFLNDANRSRMVPLPEGLFAYSAIARRLREASLRNEMSADARARYEKYAGRPFPPGTYDDGVWRSDRAAFEVLVAEAAVDWGFAWFEAAWQEMRPDLEIMRALSKEHGFRLVVALFPVTYQVEVKFLEDAPQRMFVQVMEETGIEYLDLLPALREAYQGADRSLAYDHCHLTPEGSGVAATALARLLGPTLDCAAATTMSDRQ